MVWTKSPVILPAAMLAAVSRSVSTGDGSRSLLTSCPLDAIHHNANSSSGPIASSMARFTFGFDIASLINCIGILVVFAPRCVPPAREHEKCWLREPERKWRDVQSIVQECILKSIIWLIDLQ